MESSVPKNVGSQTPVRLDAANSVSQRSAPVTPLRPTAERCIQLPEGLLREPQLTDAAVLVAGYVARFGAGEHGCFAAEATIARELGYRDSRTAGRALAALERAGWMYTETTADGHTGRKIIRARAGERANVPRSLLHAETVLRPSVVRVYVLARYWLDTGRPVSAARVAKSLPGVNLRTAKTHLRALVDHGMLLRIGQGRATCYRLPNPNDIAGQDTSQASYPQDAAEWCKSRQTDPVDDHGMVQIEARNGANRGTQNGANRAPREGAPSSEGAPEGSPIDTPPSPMDVVNAHEGSGEEFEHEIEEASGGSADADRPGPPGMATVSWIYPETETDQQTSDAPEEEQEPGAPQRGRGESDRDCEAEAVELLAALPEGWRLYPELPQEAVALVADQLCGMHGAPWSVDTLLARLTRTPVPTDGVRHPVAFLRARLKTVGDPPTAKPAPPVDPPGSIAAAARQRREQGPSDAAIRRYATQAREQIRTRRRDQKGAETPP